MVMTVAVVGLALGCIAVLVLSNTESRESFLAFSLANSILVRIFLAVYFFISRTALGIIVGIVFTVMVLVSVRRFKKSKDNVNFTSAVIELSINVYQHYGGPLLVAGVAVMLVQTFVLMAWGVYLVGLLDDISAHLMEVFSILVVFSLYWTVQFFEAFTNYVYGGCVAWYFLKPDTEPIRPAKRLTLYMFTGLTSGLGTICKGSLLCAPCQAILVVSAWAEPRSQLMSTTAPRGYSIRRLVSRLINPVVSFAQCHVRLV
jgi:hypothetical protein